jgi:hypothetical protein
MREAHLQRAAWVAASPALMQFLREFCRFSSGAVEL